MASSNEQLQPMAVGAPIVASPAEPEKPPLKRRWLRRIAKVVGYVVLALALVGTTGWSVLAVYFSDLTEQRPRAVLATLVLLATVACLLFIRPRRYGVLACFLIFGIVLVWFFSLRPSNDRDWAADVAMIPNAQMNGDTLTIRNVRNINYRSETEFVPHWEDRTYNLAQLRTVDVMLVHWGSPTIAHIIVSFGFEGGEYLAVSIEARKQKSEQYSAVQGFFRQFELIYVFADERDVVRLRTNHRNEDVYLYRTTLSPDQARAALLGYAEKANELSKRPQFYNALTSNCATNVVGIARAGDLPAYMSWRILLSGYAAEQMYDNRQIDTGLPYAELKAKSLVNAKALAADQEPDFSRAIRAGLPMPAGDAPVVPILPVVK